MNETETNKPAVSEVDVTQAQINALQRQVTTLMLALLVASGTFCVYIGLQARRARFELKNFKVAATQNLQIFKKQQPEYEAFVARLVEYGKKNADFAPIVNKYQLRVTGAPSTGTSPAQPSQSTPAQSSQPKK